MNNAFVSRKPWAAAIIALLFGPMIGCFYVNKGRLGLGYLVGFIAVIVTMFVGLETSVLNIDNVINIITLFLMILQFAGAINCFMIAKYQTYPLTLQWYSRWYALLAFVIVPMLFAIAFRTYCYEPFTMANNSMSPSVNKGDYLFVEKFAYSNTMPSRGDVIVFKINNTNSIKRIVGLPNDKIRINYGIVYINDISISRQHVKSYVLRDRGDEDSTLQFIETFPEGKEVIVLDAVSGSELDNTPVYSVPADSYFVLGDNRDNSIDSRQQSVGFVPLQNIVGKAVSIMWNNDTRPSSYNFADPRYTTNNF